MKKAISLLMALVMCLSLCACGNKLDKQADEVAEKLDGAWAAVWNAPVGEMAYLYEFEHGGGSAGKVECYIVLDGDVLQHYKGTYGVSIQTDGVVDLTYVGKYDSDGNIEKLEKIMENTLNYTYEDGELELIDGERTLVKVE